MKITSSATAVADGYRYNVARGLDGAAEAFYAGEIVVGRGQATYPELPPYLGDPSLVFPEVPFGGTTFTAMGGYLTLEGENETGPYFGVAVRHGPEWNQIVDVARFGRLFNFIGVQDGYGVAIGDIHQYLRYTYEYGLEIKTAGGRTMVSNDGLLTERFALQAFEGSPKPKEQYAHLWLDIDERQIKANVKDGGYESEAVVLDFDNPDEVWVAFGDEPTAPFAGMIWVEE